MPYFRREMAKGGGAEVTRDYKVWSKNEELNLIKCMRILVDKRMVEKGNFKLTGLKELQRMLHERVENCQLLAVPHIKLKVRYFKDKFTALLELKQASGFGWDDVRGCIVAEDDVFAGWVKSHPKASGLNSKPLPYWEDLCYIFGVDQALGAEAVQPSDAASKMPSYGAGASFMDEDTNCVESYTIPPNMDHNSVLEELINQGVDMHATSLKAVEADITSKRTNCKGKQPATSSGSKRNRQQFTDDDRARLVDNVVVATESLGKIAVNYCIEGDLAVKRQYLYHELAKFSELTVSQRTRALRHLNRDDGDANTFFQFPTEEEKLEFVWSILE
ncbi:hypothetical protein LINPERHAP2_LOCUS4603 [Linum perenne]